MPICFCFIKPQLVIARAASCNGHVHLFVCLFVCLSPNCKNVIFSKTKQFRAIDDLWEVVHGLFKEPIIGPLKSKMAEIRHLENRHDIIFSCCWGWSDLDKISPTDAEWHVDCGDMVKSKSDVEFQYGGRLSEFHGMSSQSHLPHCRVLPPGEFNVMIPELCVTLQGAATGWIQRHVIPEPRITLQVLPFGEFTVMIRDQPNSRFHGRRPWHFAWNWPSSVKNAHFLVSVKFR